MKKEFSRIWRAGLLSGLLSVCGMILATGSVQASTVVQPAQAGKGIKALIVTGQNSHDWKTSSGILKQILEDTGLFEVDLAISPPMGEPMGDFRPAFSDYPVVLLDYNGDAWPRRTQKYFLEYVQNGGGVVVYHNAGNAFPDWPEYDQIIGLGGGNRTESSGPYVFWENGKIVHDEGRGIAGYHGYRHMFPVQARDSAHPITSGLPTSWMHAEDELYSLMRGPSAHIRILATAFSDPAQKGSGRHEPVLFTVTYGKGRVFHTTLGHVSGKETNPALECVGFIVTLQRGAEWAATGRVSQPVPGGFPLIDGDLPSPGHVRRWTGYRPPSLKDILGDLESYEYGQEIGPLSRLREFVLMVKDNPDSRDQMEKEFIAFLRSDVSLAGKMAVCRHLRLIGTARSVPVLDEMLESEETADAARYALEKIPGPEADEALIRFISRGSQKQILGIISSLGQRRVSAAVVQLGQQIENSDSALAEAAARALGFIGGEEAEKILLVSLKNTEGPLQTQVATALLLCAEDYRKSGQDQLAAEIDSLLMSPSFPDPVRQAALKGLIAANPARGKSVILETLGNPEVSRHLVAIPEIPDHIDETDIEDIIELYPKLPEKSRVAVLEVFSHYPREKVLPTVLKALNEESLWIRIAALEALQAVGDASVIQELAEFAASAQGQERQTARDCLGSLKGPDVDPALIRSLIITSDPSVRVELIRAVGERRTSDGKHVLFDLTMSADSSVRLNAARNLEKIVVPADMSRLLDILIRSESEATRVELRKAVAAAAKQILVPERRSDAVVDRMKTGVTDLEQAELLRVLGAIGDRSSLPLLRQALKKMDSPVYEAAVRALTEWPDSTPMDDLLDVAGTAKNSNHRVLALRAYIQMIGNETFRLPASAIRSLKRGLTLAERPEEKKMVLALLPQYSCPEALDLARSLSSDEQVEAEALLGVQKMLYGYFKSKWFFF